MHWALGISKQVEGSLTLEEPTSREIEGDTGRAEIQGF